MPALLSGQGLGCRSDARGVWLVDGDDALVKFNLVVADCDLTSDVRVNRVRRNFGMKRFSAPCVSLSATAALARGGGMGSRMSSAGGAFLAPAPLRLAPTHWALRFRRPASAMAPCWRCHSKAKRMAVFAPDHAQSPLINRPPNSFAHLRIRNATISCWSDTNSERFRQ